MSLYSKCFQCNHYLFDRHIFLHQNSRETCLGRCTRDPERDKANLVIDIESSCEFFEPYTMKYREFDTFLSKNRGALVVHRVDARYWPRAYRVRTIAGSEFSISEEELEQQGYELIWRETDGEFER